MRRLRIPEPYSCGIFLTYKCPSSCQHCMYACSPSWRTDWPDGKELKKILVQLSRYMIGRYPLGLDRIGINQGLHFTGGEPFLNFSLLLEMTRQAHTLGIPGIFAETNCFWCREDEETRERMTMLKEAGLDGLLISVNPFILEYVPYEQTRRAIRISREIFKRNVLIYQEIFYRQFMELGLKTTCRFDNYLSLSSPDSLRDIELLPMGRSAYRLSHLFGRSPAERFFGESCRAELTRDWHIHIDNYWNYIPGYCGGLSLGDARDLDALINSGIDLSDYPILRTLTSDIEDLYTLAIQQFNYREQREGYISKCHLCLDVRRWLAHRTDVFKELQPKEFYLNLR